MDSLCRLCCSNNKIAKMNDLFDDKNTRLLQKLKHFAYFTFNISVNDGFPPYICNRCTGLLEVAHEFKLICESAVENFLVMDESDIIIEVDEECDQPIELIEELKEELSYNDAEISDSHVAKVIKKSDGFTKIKELRCNICSLRTTNEIDIINHMNIHQLRSKPCVENIRKVYKNYPIGSTCQFCEESFQSKRALHKHWMDVHKSEQKKQKPLVICEICGKTYKTQFLLKYHINGTHVENVEKVHCCNICDFKSRTLNNLITHTLRHTGEKPHQCGECEQRFRFQSSLTRHVNVIHKNIRRHKCTICNRAFKDVRGLKEHSYSHSGEVPNSCSQCPSAFRYKSSLRRHVIKCHSNPVQSVEG